MHRSMLYTEDEQFYALLRDDERKAECFAQVVRAFQEPLYWHIRHMVLDHDDANDVLQNTFMKAWGALVSFRGESKLSTWLYRIATNETLTFLQQKKLRAQANQLCNTEELAAQLEADPYFDGGTAERLLQQAIQTLPEKQRLVFNMRYFRDIKYEEMSQIFGTTEGALKASYHIAVKKIEDFFRARS